VLKRKQKESKLAEREKRGVKGTMRQVPRPRLDSALQGANESLEQRGVCFLESIFTATAVASVLSFFAAANR